MKNILKSAILLTISIIANSAYSADKCPGLSSIHCYYTPQNISSIAGHAFSSGQSIPTDTTFIVLHNTPTPISPTPLSNWHVGDFTTLDTNISRSVYQRSFASQNGYGTTAGQMKGNETGLHLHTNSTPGIIDSNHPIGIVTLQLSHHFSSPIKPWGNDVANANEEICLSFNASIPNSFPNSITNAQYLNSQGTANYMGSILFINDGAGHGFHFTQRFFDNRQNVAAEYVANDVNVGAYAASYYKGSGVNGAYNQGIPSSNSIQHNTWNGYKFFGTCISKTHLQNIVASLNINGYDFNDGGNDWSNYQIAGFSISTEIAQKNINLNGHISAKVKSPWVYKSK